MATKLSHPKVNTKELLQFYKSMLIIRQLESRLTELSQQGVLRGSLHLAQGQEAIPVGACAALDPGDYLTVTYRGHGYILSKGCDLYRVIAEILGRKTGLGKGKGGKMHLTDLDRGLLGANGIVGAGVPIAVGAAMSAQIDGNGRVAMTVFGDGTLNQGVTHEAMNMAGLWKLPIIFMCENNLYAEMTPLEESTAITDLSSRMAAYGIQSHKIDGNDVLAVRDAVAKARADCLEGKGPVFIEAMTYRTCGHYQNDPGTAYRTKNEVSEWLERSPIDRTKKLLTDSDADPQALGRAEKEAIAEVEAALKRAIDDPEPDASELLEDLFA